MTTPNEDTPRSIELEVEVPGTPEEVWEAIATGPGITAWFVPAQVEEREGGSLSLDIMGKGMEAAGVVTAWDPPRRFVYEEKDPFEADSAARLATEWLVESRSGAPASYGSSTASSRAARTGTTSWRTCATVGARTCTTCGCT